MIAVAGADRVAFLQGIVSNDVERAAPGRAVWAAFLTPQGKYLADFFMLSDGETLFLDAEAAQVPMLVQKLGRFRLRAAVSLAPRPDLSVYVSWPGEKLGLGEKAGPGEGTLPDGAIAAADPRLPDAGWRILSPHPLAASATRAEWDAHRIGLGLPDGTRDLEPDKTVLLEAGFDELHGVSWTKGCYMGQELTARTRYRGLVKRRLVPVTIDGPAPAPGTPVTRDGVEVGTMRSAANAAGLAVLRLDALAGTLLSAGATLRPNVPGWFALPAAQTAKA